MTTALWIAGVWAYLTGMGATYRLLDRKCNRYEGPHPVPVFGCAFWPFVLAAVGPLWICDAIRDRRAAKRIQAERELRDAERLLRGEP
jgi:hypothetical protein